ncbi:MAG: hypothetical protein Q4D31_01115 [Eubacteriales bacterium]|nr:hypothetical protein [Eubacteriales bacterium]
MVSPNELVLVCTGRDVARAAGRGFAVLHLCLGITPAGALQRLQLPTAQARCLLGLCDSPRGLAACDPARLAADLTFEARRTGAPGVFADLEHDTPHSHALLAACDAALHEAKIPFYVPLSCGRALPHAVLTASTALSGGSLTAYLAGLRSTYGAARVAAFLQPVSQDLTMPSTSADGTTLTPDEREALLARTGSQPFFSRELCAKYFTYTDDAGRAHFVLYDDLTTIEAKFAQLRACGVPTVFALFPDVSPLLELP